MADKWIENAFNLGSPQDATPSTEVRGSSHTPGPWEVLGQSVIESSSGETITVIPGYHKANSRLIAAAPDLLEALKMSSKVMVMACGTESPYIRVALKSIDLAIAKAELPPRTSLSESVQTDAANKKEAKG